MSSQPKSAAKHKQPSADPEGQTTRITRSKAAGQKQVTSLQEESLKKEKIRCKVCRKEFTQLLSHLKRSVSCAAQYDMPAMEAEEQRRRTERKAMTDKELYKQHTAEKRAASKEYYNKHTPEKRAASKEYYNKHTAEKRAASKEHYNKHTPEKREQVS